MAKAEKDQVVAAIVRVLGPYVGSTMAKASALGTCEKLGFRSDRIDRAHLPQIVEALAPGLGVFVGRDKAKGVVDTLNAELSNLPAVP